VAEVAEEEVVVAVPAANVASAAPLRRSQRQRQRQAQGLGGLMREQGLRRAWTAAGVQLPGRRGLMSLRELLGLAALQLLLWLQ
jgi:hypothetical protein